MDIEYIEDKKHNPCNWCVYSSTKDSESSMCKRCEFWQLREAVERGVASLCRRYVISEARCYKTRFEKGKVTADVLEKALALRRMVVGMPPDKIIVSEDLFAGLMELMQVTYKFDREVRECSFLGIPITKMEGMGEIVLCKNTDVVLVPEEDE